MSSVSLVQYSTSHTLSLIYTYLVTVSVFQVEVFYCIYVYR
jgi:hypothetical protein